MVAAHKRDEARWFQCLDVGLSRETHPGGKTSTFWLCSVGNDGMTPINHLLWFLQTSFPTEHQQVMGCTFSFPQWNPNLQPEASDSWWGSWGQGGVAGFTGCKWACKMNQRECMLFFWASRLDASHGKCGFGRYPIECGFDSIMAPTVTGLLTLHLFRPRPGSWFNPCWRSRPRRWCSSCRRVAKLSASNGTRGNAQRLRRPAVPSQKRRCEIW